MKPLLLFTSFILASVFLNAQQTATSSDYLASTGGIGPFRIGMSRAATEKLLNKKLPPSKSLLSEGYEMDTIKCTYKEMKLDLIFSHSYYGKDTAVKLGIYSITSSYPMVKTKSGVGIGDDKIKIIKTYELFRLNIMPEWTDEGKPNPKRSTVTLYDNDSQNVIVFHLDNNIITAMESTQYIGD